MRSYSIGIASAILVAHLLDPTIGLTFEKPSTKLERPRQVVDSSGDVWSLDDTTIAARGYVAVDWMGAGKGDGDSTAIQAADDLASRLGLEVRFGAKTYLVEKRIDKKPGSIWRGVGRFKSILRYSGGAGPHDMIGVASERESVNDIAFFDLGFDGNRQADEADQNRSVVLIRRGAEKGNLSPARNFQMERCRIVNFPYMGFGLMVFGYERVRISNNELEDGGGHRLFHLIYLRRVRRAILKDNSGVGRDGNGCFKVQFGQEVAIERNRCEGGGRGIVMQDAQDYTVRANTLHGQTEAGIVSNIDKSKASSRNVISGNRIDGAAVGIELSNAAFHSVEGNVISDFGSYGMKFRATRHSTIVGNKISLGAQPGGRRSFYYFDEKSTVPNSVRIEGNESTNSRESGAEVLLFDFDLAEGGTSGAVIGDNPHNGPFESIRFDAP